MRSPSLILLRKELREILRAPSYWALWMVLSPLVGYSFLQAVELYAGASRSAAPYPDLARSLSPLDGVLVPTLGAYYLVLTFLFPFLAIRSLGAEKQSGSLKLLLQLPLRPSSVVGIKILSLSLAGLLLVLPGLSAVVIWRLAGGHIFIPETLNLALGYGLYAFAVAGISIFASSVTEGPSSAAIVALAIILGSWVLDFAGGTTEGWLGRASALSLTASLRAFEHGLFSWPQVWRLICIGAGFSVLAMAWLASAPMARKVFRSVLVAAVAIVAMALGGRMPWYADMSEDRRNSFGPVEERALRNLSEPLEITVHLSREDSRFREMDHNIFDKLRRLVPKLEIIVPNEMEAGSAESGDNGDYGWIEYAYAGKKQRSTSNSEEEIFSILHELSGQKASPGSADKYPGYPLVADVRPWSIWFYGLLPMLGLIAAWLFRHGAKRFSF